MENNPLFKVISRVDQRIDALLEDYLQLEETCEQLAEENKTLKKDLQLKNSRIVDLKKSIIVLKKTRSQSMTNEDQKALNKILDEYIREIDRCISELSRN